MSDQQVIAPDATEGYDDQGRHFRISRPDENRVTLTYDDSSTVTQTPDGHLLAESVVNPDGTRTDYGEFDVQNRPLSGDGPDGTGGPRAHFTISYDDATGEKTEHFPRHSATFSSAGVEELDTGTDQYGHYVTQFTDAGSTTAYDSGDVLEVSSDGRPTYEKVVSPPPEGSPPGTPKTVVEYTEFGELHDGKWLSTAGTDNRHGHFARTYDWSTSNATTAYDNGPVVVVDGDGDPVSESGTDQYGHYVTQFTDAGSTTRYDSGDVLEVSSDGRPTYEKVVSPPPEGSPPGTPKTVVEYTEFGELHDGKWLPTAGTDNRHGHFARTYDWSTSNATTAYDNGPVVVVDGDGDPVSESGTDQYGHYVTQFTDAGSTTRYDSGDVLEVSSDGRPTYEKVVSPPPEGSPPGTPKTVVEYTEFGELHDGKWLPTAGHDSVNGDFRVSYDWATNQKTYTYDAKHMVEIFDGDNRPISVTTVVTRPDGTKKVVTQTFDYNRPDGEYVVTVGDQHTLYKKDGTPIKQWTGNDESTAELYDYAGLNGETFWTDGAGNLTEYDKYGKPMFTWDKDGKEIIDWGAEPGKLYDAWQQVSKRIIDIDYEYNSVKKEFDLLPDTWRGPSGGAFGPIVYTFKAAMDDMQGVLREAARRLYDTYLNVHDVENNNTQQWTM